MSITYAEEQIDNHLKLNITIEDTGIGIPKNKVNTVFNRFAQIDSSYKKQHEGSGLGLAISKDLATKLGGSITVQSTENQGSKFEITVLFEILKNQGDHNIKETFNNLTSHI